jgi:DNA gyrase subunit A
MAKQLNLLATGQVIPTSLHSEMQRSYLEYAMSVIVGRALPDVRDGLKPVHRRILYAMYELGLTPDRPYRKCARVVGDVLGKYHPHGDQAVYEALARMVQDWVTRYPLVAGHGNFGSVDNDPPAAMRYTETRLASISHEVLLTEIGESTVDFTGNFDNSQQEPLVLPAQLPVLLLNGCTGIAVGMATNIPPHNLGEIVDALVALIDKPDLPDAQLWSLIPAPDFPTGGEIIENGGIKEAYSTGRGSITIRGVAQIEEMPATKGRRRRQAIIITELPYQVSKAGWIEKLAESVNQGKIEGIADVRDESDREGMRVVIELKRDAEGETVLEQLYKQTALQINFGTIMLALVDSQPRQLSLRQLLEYFLEFRERTLTQRYTHELTQAQKRLHLVAGWLKALNNLDAVIDILRNSPDGSSAKLRLQEELALSEEQGDAILGMPMRRLTGLEKENLQREFGELTSQIEILQKLLSDRHELLKSLKKDLRALKRRYADPRRTKISKQDLPTPEPEQPATPTERKPKKAKVTVPTPEEPLLVEVETPSQVVLEFTTAKSVYKVSPEANNRNSKPKADLCIQSETISSDSELVLLTDAGKAYAGKLADIPLGSMLTTGTPLTALLPNSAQSAGEKIVAYSTLPLVTAANGLILLTAKGQIKRISTSELVNLTSRGLSTIKLKENDVLKYASWHYQEPEILITTSGGRFLRFSMSDRQLPVMGRTSQGVPALRLGREEEFIGVSAVNSTDTLLLITNQGYIKQISVNTIRLANRGDIGTQALQFSSKTDSLVGAVVTSGIKEVAVLSDRPRTIILSVDKLPTLGKDGTGDRIGHIKAGENILEVLPILTESL